jgi:ribonuclease HII
MKMSTFNLEKKLSKQGYRIIIGVDEAGRGPLAGPVVAAAVLLRNFEFRPPAGGSNFESNINDKIFNDKELNLVRDSKTLSAKQREECFQFLTHHPQIKWGVGMVSEKTIDRINILQATFVAMRKAVAALTRNLKLETRNSKLFFNVSRQIILVDGNKIIPNLKIEQRAIVKGDKKVKSISAASIIAKVTRDCLMRKMDKKYPKYGFAKHKGYGTKIHLQNLKKYGPSSIHRLSFHPIKKA